MESLDLLNVKRQQYHGNVFVGNHCQNFLKNYEVLTNCIADYVDLRCKFNDILSIYASISALTSSKRFLSVQNQKS